MVENRSTLDKLVQLSPRGDGEADFQLNKSTGVEDRRALLKRARSKYFTNAIVSCLVALDSPLKSKYVNTLNCCTTLTKRGEKVTGNYCKNRWCMVCNRIRTAQLIKKYSPVLQEWENKCFVTLTVPNIKGKRLRRELERMQYQLKLIRQKFHKRKVKFSGVRKLEVTYNPNRDDYHPHYHFIIEGEEVGRELLREWLERFPEAKRKAQDVREADNETVMELFKYFTKVITPTSKAVSGVEVNGQIIYPAALDVIFQSVRGLRTYEHFGFKVAKEEGEEEVEEGKEVSGEEVEVSVYQWEQSGHDWVNKETGEVLTGYAPSVRFRSFVEGIGKGVLKSNSGYEIESRCRGDDS